MDPTTLVLLLLLFGPAVIRIPEAAGGFSGIWHRQVREPVLTAIAAAATYFLGAWLVQDHGPQSVLSAWRGMGGLLIAFAIVIWFIALSRASSELGERKAQAERIADELDELLDPTDTHFVVDASNAHRPLELLDELAQLIGPGRYAPGQPWATHQWIADRMAAARAVKPAEPSHRIEKSTS